MYTAQPPQLTGTVALSQAISYSIKLVVVSLATSVDEGQTSSPASVVVVGGEISSTRTRVWGQRAGVNACPQGTQNKAS